MYVDTLWTSPAAYILTLIVGLAQDYLMPANWCQETIKKNLKTRSFYLKYQNIFWPMQVIELMKHQIKDYMDVLIQEHKPFPHFEDLEHLH